MGEPPDVTALVSRFRGIDGRFLNGVFRPWVKCLKRIIDNTVRNARIGAILMLIEAKNEGEARG